MVVVLGNGQYGTGGDGGSALAAQTVGVSGVAVDSLGNVYVSDGNRVRRITTAGAVSTFAGSTTAGFAGDGGPATSALLSIPVGVAVDGADNVYVADWGNGRIRRVTPAGVISTVAGSSNFAVGDGGPATNAELREPSAVAVGPDGTMFIAEYETNRVRKVTPSGIISTFAGNGVAEYSGDGGPAINASLSGPTALALDVTGNLLVAERNSHRIRRVTPAGTITTFAGGSPSTFAGDGGPATAAGLNFPSGLTVDAGGTVWIADSGNHRVRKVSPAGVITTVAGTGTNGTYPDGGVARANPMSSPTAVAMDNTGCVLVADQSLRVGRLAPGGDGFVALGADRILFGGTIDETGHMGVLADDSASVVALRVVVRADDRDAIVSIGPLGGPEAPQLVVAAGPGETATNRAVVRVGFANDLDVFGTPGAYIEVWMSGYDIAGSAVRPLGPLRLTTTTLAAGDAIDLDATGLSPPGGTTTTIAQVSFAPADGADADVWVSPVGQPAPAVATLAARGTAPTVALVDVAGTRLHVTTNAVGTLTVDVVVFVAGATVELPPLAPAVTAVVDAADHALVQWAYPYGADEFIVTLTPVAGSSVALSAPSEARLVAVSLPEGTYHVAVRARRDGVLSATVFPPDLQVPGGAGAPSRFVPLPPTRILDTRVGRGAPATPIGAGATIIVDATTASVPAGAAALAVNLTATDTTGPGYVTAWASGPRPTVSNLNIPGAGATVANGAFVPVAPDATFNLYTQTSTQLVADVTGYWIAATSATSGRIEPIFPTRVLDTRIGLGATGPVPAAGSIDLRVAGSAEVPADASAVIVNLTATDTAAAGYFTIWPTGAARGSTSSLNVTAARQTRANLVVAPIGSDGRISIYTQAGAHLVADITGYITGDTAPDDVAGLYVALPPTRVVDTRPTHPLKATDTRRVHAAGSADVPLIGASAIVANLTLTETLAPGYLSAWPDGTPRPTVSSLNASRAGETVPNLALLALGAEGGFDTYANVGTHLLVDVAGYTLG